MNHCTSVKTYLYVLALFVTLTVQAAAARPMTEPPEALSAVIENLLAYTNSSQDTALGLDLIPYILDFVDAPKQLDDSFPLGDRNGASSDYYEFTLNRSFDQVVGLAFNPELPTFLTTPSSVRRSHWVEVKGQHKPFPKFSLDFIDMKTPLVVNGIEFIENSPDENSGAYYAYQLRRTLIFMVHNGRRVLISISSQPKKSDVGKKGLVVGKDEDWNYLYTGEPGTTMRGLGWADTYIYGSETIMVYYETAGVQQKVKCGAFKWINAGWAGMNFAEPQHIRRGIERFAKDFSAIVEYPELPELGELVRMFKKINGLSMDDLREKSSDYFDHLRRRYENSSPKYEEWFAKLFKDQTYLESLSREEMQALISIEYLKCLMGKPHRWGAEHFATWIANKKPS